MSDLTQKHCLPCEGGVPPMTKTQIEKALEDLPNWKIGRITLEKEQESIEIDRIYRKYTFKNYYKTMAFVNAIAWMAHQENHHPDLMIGYDYCLAQYSTHAIGGLSENDFICAAKADALYENK